MQGLFDNLLIGYNIALQSELPPSAFLILIDWVTFYYKYHGDKNYHANKIIVKANLHWAVIQTIHHFYTHQHLLAIKTNYQHCLPVERLHSAKELLVVATVDEHLCVILHRLCKHRKWPCVELLLFPNRQLLSRHLRLGLGQCTATKTHMLFATSTQRPFRSRDD